MNISINGTLIDMEVDTGAFLSIISEATYAYLQSQGKASPLMDTDVVLRTYTGEEVRLEGSLEVKVAHEGKEFTLPLLVVKGKGPALLGRNWLEKVRLNWPMIKQSVPMNLELETVVQSYSHLFNEGLGTLHGIKPRSMLIPQPHLGFTKPDQYHMHCERKLNRILKD